MKNFIVFDPIERDRQITSSSLGGERSRRCKLMLLAVITSTITVIGCIYIFLIEGSDPWHRIPILFSFVSLGILIKYGDQAFDDQVFNQKYALILAIPAGFWMGALIALDTGSATIFIGLLFALLIAAKYDNLAFQIGFLIATVTGIIGLVLNSCSIDLIGVGLVFVAAYMDERINELECVERRTTLFTKILKERPFLKLMVLLLSSISILSSYLYFFAFLAFDFGYSFMECVSMEVMNDAR